MSSKLLKVLGSLLLLASSTTFATQKTIQPINKDKVKVTEDVTVPAATLICTKGANDKLLCKPIEKGEIELTTTNLIVLRGPITAQSASKFVREFNALEHRDETTRIYVYINSPGGSIFAGDYITNILSASKKEVVVIIDFAASMAFHISQFANKKLIIPTGTMMQHHASGGPNPQQFPNVDKEWSWLKRKVKMMNKKDSAGCYKTAYKQFIQNIDRDWWLLSDEALAAGCVDGLADKVTCSKDLASKVDVEEVSFFGMKIVIEWAACPLEPYPRKVTVSSALGSSWDNKLTAEQNQLADEYVMLVTDPLQYYNTYGSFGIHKFVGKKLK